MRHNHPYSESEDAEIRRRILRGETSKQVATGLAGRFGRTIQGVERRAQRLDAKPDLPRESQRPASGKVIALGDLHHPYTNWPTFRAIVQFVSDFKPDLLVLGGDVFEMEQFSFFNRERANLLSHLDSPRKMYADGVRDVLRPLRKAAGDGCWVSFMEGNHEHRVERFVEEDAKAVDWRVRENLDGIVDEVLPYESHEGTNVVSIGKLNYMHWPLGNKMVAVYHARPVAEQYAIARKPMRYFHTHTRQTHTAVSPMQVREFFIAESVPCVCDRNPAWLLNGPNRWVHGFTHAYVDKDGHFQDWVTVVVNGRFRAEGVVYKG